MSEGFMAYYVGYAPEDTDPAISVFNNLQALRRQTGVSLAWIEKILAPCWWGGHRGAGPVCDRAYAGLAREGAGSAFAISEGIRKARRSMPLDKFSAG